MKLLESPSVASSSSFDPNICTSKSTAAGFLSGILRRFLCLRTLPTFPSDLITEASSVVGENKMHSGNPDQVLNSPGIVARLMGLESSPETASSAELSTSRSTNSVKFRAECVADGKKIVHRRVKSTMSVRENPTFVETENEQFFVLSFDDGGDHKRGGKPVRKKEKLAEMMNNEDEEKIKKMVSKILNEGCISSRILNEVNHEIHESHWKNSNLDSLHKFDFIYCNQLTHDVATSSSSNNKRKKKKKKKKKKINDEEPQCSSEESSPVSVLDFNQFLIHPSDKEESNLENDFMVQDQNLNKTTETCHISSRKPCKSLDGSSLWSEICKVSESEVMFSNWIQKNNSKLEDFEEIGEDLGHKIMDELLEELLDLQLV